MDTYLRQFDAPSNVKQFCVALLSIAFCGCLVGGETPAPWPQWRGPDRDNISRETGLLKEWPEGGPPLVWEMRGVGIGIAAVAVAGGRIYVLGYIGDTEFLTALDERTAQRLWVSRVGRNAGEIPLMRWLGQRTPTVDGERVYAFHNRGQLVCFETQTGKELWRKDYVADFGMTGNWGFCDRPLVDGDKLICTPGGTKAAMVALNKKTGEVIWQSRPMGNAAHAATVISEAGGVRQYVGFVLGKALSFRASDGQYLWSHTPFGRTGNSCTPIVWKDHVLLSAGFGVGITLLKLSPDGEGLKTDVVYAVPANVFPFQDSALLVGGHVYGLGYGGRFCMNVETGEIKWGPKDTAATRAGMTCADGHLYFLSSDGKVELVEATPEKYKPKSAFTLPDYKRSDSATNPVIANGRLFLRNEDRLFCYDVREAALKEPRPKAEVITLPAPPKVETAPAMEVYVPTPQDVCEKMLELADVKQSDVVVDLGSGDGRIVITAAKKYGCKSTGYELDEELTRLSQQSIEQAGLKELAAIERKDVLTADLGGASVITMYFSESFLKKLRPQLEKLKPGTRIVSHQFQIPGATPEKMLGILSPHDGVQHAIYLWTIPLKESAR